VPDKEKSRLLRLRRQGGGFDRLQERDAKEARFPLERHDRLGADAAPGFVDHAAEGFVGLAIVGGGGETNERQRVLDLGASVVRDLA
jgi:hypothetical protein